MIWKWFASWQQARLARREREAKAEDRFQALLDEAERRRGDLSDAVRELREDRERRQALSVRRRRSLSSRPAPEPRTSHG